VGGAGRLNRAIEEVKELKTREKTIPPPPYPNK
jgi:hypothetical protein